MTYTPIPAGTLNWDVPVNAAFTDQDTRITTNSSNISNLQAQGINQPGVYIPPGWGSFWRPKRDNAQAAGARILAAGDSLTQGRLASSTKNTSWVGLLRQEVQGTYGNGGSGFFSVSNTDTASSASVGATAAWIANGSFMTEAGTWALGSSDLGPGLTFLTANAAGATLTCSVTGSTIKIYNFSGSAPRAAFTYSIDGGAPVNVVVPVGPTAVQVTTITGLSNAPHQVVLAWNGAPADIFYPIGVSGEHSTGVIVDNMGKSGSRATQWGAAGAFLVPYNGGVSYPADLVTVSLGLNDAANAVTSTAWANAMGIYLNGVRQANNGQTDIIIIQQHVGTFGDPALYSQYGNLLRSMADNYGAALVNMWELGRNSWDYWNSLGYWGDLNAPGPAGNDTVHLSDAGHAYIASIVNPIVMS